jgi:hypothetical protein
MGLSRVIGGLVDWDLWKLSVLGFLFLEASYDPFHCHQPPEAPSRYAISGLAHAAPHDTSKARQSPAVVARVYQSPSESTRVRKSPLGTARAHQDPSKPAKARQYSTGLASGVQCPLELIVASRPRSGCYSPARTGSAV